MMQRTANENAACLRRICTAAANRNEVTQRVSELCVTEQIVSCSRTSQIEDIEGLVADETKTSGF